MLHLLVAVLESDADGLAVGVVRALRTVAPSLDVSRLGGIALAREDTRDIAISGSLTSGLQRTPVDAALLVGGGRVGQARLGRRLRRHGVPVAILAGPARIQWPWPASRLAAACDLVIASPIDDVEDLLAAGATVHRVGHPMADDVTLPLAEDRAAARRTLGLGEDLPVVAVCAGAAGGDLPCLAPVLREALRHWQGSGERLQVAIAVSGAAQADPARRLLGGAPGVTVHAAPARTVVTAADVALCSDGETTLLAALLGTPLLLARRRTWTERAAQAVAPSLGGRVVPFEAWPNRVAGEFVVPELVDDDFRGARLAREVVALVEHAADQARRLADVRKAVRADRAWASIARLLVDLAVAGAPPATGQPPTVKRNS
ncbi:lipid-A-disaccharide synthase [Luteitalea sp. TBR-22]|uniref:hypothetical protein n=1 Tax=Luteitalea sp. TBR-22 TaxID=2802971 RepID=UPI001AF58014|nr:hypothetical protein [Luteitalea sp. TBR-22]BCS32870.1 lipid-A-disaccharide synthase [Luteitalea sp. TBR-22]